MTAKQFLYSVRDEQKEIEEIGDRIYELEMSGMWSSRTSMKRMNDEQQTSGAAPA